MDEIVKYHNILNSVSFRDFTENDFNLFMCLCAKLRDLGEVEQKYDYSYIMDLIGWDKSQRIEVFHDEIKRMTNKIRQIGGVIDISPDEFICFNLFDTFRGNKQKRILTVSINPKYKYVLNDLTKNFTNFELKEYVSLNGRYAKLLYQHLKQYKKTGWWSVSLEAIRHELSIPDSMPTMNIKIKVLTPSIEVVRTCKGFSDLQVEVIRSQGRGRKVEGYKFTWTAEGQIKGQAVMDLNAIDPDKASKPGKLGKPGKGKKTFTMGEQRNTDYDAIVQERVLKRLSKPKSKD